MCVFLDMYWQLFFYSSLLGVTVKIILTDVKFKYSIFQILTVVNASGTQKSDSCHCQNKHYFIILTVTAVRFLFFFSSRLIARTERFQINFGEVLIPAGIDVPKIRILPEFKRLAHGLRSDNISILDAKTFYIPNLHYDGAGPAAYFWVGNGSEPHRLGIKVPNEVRSLEPLRGYQGEDIEIQLPGSLTVYDIDWLCVWCIRYTQNFGHVMLPKDLDVPPALNQTKISVSLIRFLLGGNSFWKCAISVCVSSLRGGIIQ